MKAKKVQAVEWTPTTCSHERTHKVTEGFYRFWQCLDCGLTRSEGFTDVDAAAQCCAMLDTQKKRHDFVKQHMAQFPDIEAKAQMAWNNRDVELKKRLYRKTG